MKVVLQSIEGDIPLYFLLLAVASKNFIVDKDIGTVYTYEHSQSTTDIMPVLTSFQMDQIGPNLG